MRVLAAIMMLCWSALGADWYVATNGTPAGPGTLIAPYDLPTALLNSFPAQPGDTIWLRGGTYFSTNGFLAQKSGTATQPIIYRNYNGESVEITTTNLAVWDGTNVTKTSSAPLVIYTFTTNTWWWGLEFDNSNPNRYRPFSGTLGTRGEGVTVYGPQTKLINCLVHDGGDGVGVWSSSFGAEVYGCIVYDNGDCALGAFHGHGFYMQNDAGTNWMTLSDTFTFGGMSGALQIYGHVGALNNISVTRAVFPDAIWVGGASPVQNITFTNDWFYAPGPNSYRGSLMGWQEPNISMAFVQNYFENYTPRFWFATNLTILGNSIFTSPAAGNPYDSMGVDWSGLTGLAQPITIPFGALSWNINSNLYAGNRSFYTNGYPCGGSPPFIQNAITYTVPNWTNQGWDVNSTFLTNAPASNIVAVYTNKYDPNRGHVVIRNWRYLSAVPVDLSPILTNGAPYVIYNVQDIKGSPITAGKYLGGTVAIPMTDPNMTAPLGWTNIFPTTLPQFGFFLVLNQLGGSGEVIAGNVRAGGDIHIPGS